MNVEVFSRKDAKEQRRKVFLGASYVYRVNKIGYKRSLEGIVLILKSEKG